ncbi:NADPH-dependent oxidoreductase [Candidatus Peregrinibacteria bacterium]|nr:NADPH-dependent oxidoreductase [Candidatus Peregrinibacteria bacterium]
MYVPIILGTARKGRQSEKVANFIFEQCKKNGLDTEIIDVRDFLIGATDNSKKISESKKLTKIVKNSDGLIIVSPEYNHSFPGELKIMLDMLFEEYSGKAVGICGVSGGNFGGTRMVEELNKLILTINMIPTNTPLYFPDVKDMFDLNGKTKNEKLIKRSRIFFGVLKKYINASKKLK